MTDLAKRFGAPLSTVHDEAQRLTDAGLLTRRDAGRSAMLQAAALVTEETPVVSGAELVDVQPQYVNQPGLVSVRLGRRRNRAS